MGGARSVLRFSAPACPARAALAAPRGVDWAKVMVLPGWGARRAKKQAGHEQWVNPAFYMPCIDRSEMEWEAVQPVSGPESG